MSTVRTSYAHHLAALFTSLSRVPLLSILRPSSMAMVGDVRDAAHLNPNPKQLASKCQQPLTFYLDAIMILEMNT
jgi:hypothetical protein